MKRMWQIILIVLILIILLVFSYFFIGGVKQADNITWGINFSQKQVRDLGLDEKETYLAILDELGAQNIRIAVHWDEIEKEDNVFYCDFLDWQMKEAEKRGVNIILSIGMKTPRWPETHIPAWVDGLSKEQQQAQILEMEKYLVKRYEGYNSLYAWQIENEPLFNFGTNPWLDKDFLKEEFNTVRDIDDEHLKITTDSGEMSMWFSVAKIADMVGITMYRKVWSSELNKYFSYFYPPQYYGRKAELIEKLFGKKVICLELQAEPWCPDLTWDCTIEEQAKTMDLEKFKANLEFAQKTGLDTFYLWGAEWWYWMKIQNNNSDIWDEAKDLWN
jgi:hypothetical protein